MGRGQYTVWVELLMFGIIYSSEVCYPPPIIEHSGNNATLDATFPEGTQIKYFCDLLTYRDGWPVYTCENGSWTNGGDHDMICLWKRCPEPLVEHGSYAADSLTVGNFAIFQCDEGFKLKGSSRALCRVDRKWTYLPSCHIVRCNSTTRLPHMDRFQNSYGREQNIYGNTIRNTCEEGFELIGPSIQTCDGDGRWTGPTPYCQEIDCGEPKIGSGRAYYDTTKYGSDVLIECYSDAMLEGDEFMLCLEDGWTYSYCHGACNISHIDNGYTESSRLLHGQTLAWSCDRGFIKQPMVEVSCRSGNLTDTPKCNPITFGQDASCPMSLPDGYHVTRFLDKCYIFIDVHINYLKAKQICQRHGWTMVNIDTDQEMVFVAAALDELWTERTWLGITFSDGRDAWVNTNGLTTNYTKWSEGEGKKTWLVFSSKKFEKCAVIEYYRYQTRMWNDVRCTASARAMCEVNARFNGTARFHQNSEIQ